MTWLIVFVALVVVAAVVGLVRKRRRYGGSEPSGSQPMKIRDVTDHVLRDDFMTHKQFRD
jgi:ribosomal protein S19E (S16A)